MQRLWVKVIYKINNIKKNSKKKFRKVKKIF
jgi:hypothetical protein